MTVIEKQPGTYILLIELDQPQIITAGKRGAVHLPAGLYAYVGSAHGPGGLRARLRRHARPDKRLHWHVDYLLASACLNGALFRVDPARLECSWAAFVSQRAQAVPDFGASDCRCDSHLFHLGPPAVQADFVAWAAQALGTSFSTEL